MKQSLRLGTVSGIPVGLHWGLVLIALVYLANLATGVLPAAAPGFSDGAYWITAAAGVALFFGSILVHELAHSLVAQREGIGVRAITLWLLGGVAEIERDADSAGAEFRIAVAGPVSSLALGALFAGAGAALDATGTFTLAATMLTWLGIINVILAVFNLIPAAPLDGGRILAAIVWWRSGNPHRARARAAAVGQAFGLVLLAVGALILFNGGGFWILLVAWFVHAGATAERRRAEIFDVATRLHVADAMVPLARPTDPGVTAAGLVAMSGDGRVAFPIRGGDGAIEGIVPAHRVAMLPPSRRDVTTARDLMVGWDQFISARADERLEAVLGRFGLDDHQHALVYDGAGDPVGYLGFAEVAGARDHAAA